ncbi:MAG: DUF4352 domain-containing protein [Anaerolineaceae bacterium]|nr:DUF4352 domain-containing protein [Anaerolineaceae bacterium]
MRRLMNLVLTMMLLMVAVAPLLAQDDVEVCSPADIAARADEAVEAYEEQRANASNMDVALARLSTLEDALGEIQSLCINIASEGIIPQGSGALSDPFVYGELGDIGQGFSVQVTGLIRPGNQVVYTSNPYNDRPQEGMEYAIVKVRVVCNSDASGICSVDYSDFYLVGALGQIYDDAPVVYDDDLDVELLAGGSGEGGIVFEISRADSDLKLLYREGYFSDTFVAFEAIPSGAASILVTSTASLNVRGGPGTNHAVVANFPKDEVDVALGRNSDGNWIQISSGWVFADLVEITGDISSLVVTSS